MNDRVPLAEAAQVARDLVAELSPWCERFVIAGSVRRRKETVKDIEAVAEPRFSRRGQRTLLGDGEPTSDLDIGLSREIECGFLARDDKLKRWGEKYKRLVHPVSGIPVDLFIVTPPAQWGVVLAIRTGPAAFSQALVTRARRMGMRTHEGALYRFFDPETDHEAWTQGVDIPIAADSKKTAPAVLVPTPDEKDFFEALDLRWFAPEDRDRPSALNPKPEAD